MYIKQKDEAQAKVDAADEKINGELKKENFDACDAYVACLGFLNKEKKGELIFKSSNIKNNDKHFEYDLEFWDNKEHRKTFF